MVKPSEKKLKSTIDIGEIGQFDSLGDSWWSEEGPMKPLHKINPVRLDYLRRTITAHFKMPHDRLRALQGLSIADIGCGGGLVAEPLCRMGADVTGIDAGPENIRVAKAHAKKHGLYIDYRATTVEAVAAKGESFDVVTALEIIEHVSDVDLFVSACCKIVKKGGMIVFSTLNRTPKSFLLGIVAAEYILRWLKPGTHTWKKFQKPSEIAKRLQENGFKLTEVKGMVYNPLTRSFSISDDDIDVNYFLVAVRK